MVWVQAGVTSNIHQLTALNRLGRHSSPFLPNVPFKKNGRSALYGYRGVRAHFYSATVAAGRPVLPIDSEGKWWLLFLKRQQTGCIFSFLFSTSIIICWFPSDEYFLILTVKPDFSPPTAVVDAILNSAYFQATIDPIVFVLSVKNLRDAVKKLFCARCSYCLSVRKGRIAILRLRELISCILCGTLLQEAEKVLGLLANTRGLTCQAVELG